MQPATSEQLDQIFAALAHPARRAVLRQLSAGEASIGELVDTSDLQQPAISKHVKVLEAAGLVRRTKQAQLRLCHLEPEPLRNAFEWLGEYQRFWTGSFDRLETYLTTLDHKD